MLLFGALGVVVVAVLIVFGVPWVEAMLNTVSTDDAFVNGHVTFVAPRVAGQISRVLVDDNNRVRKGDLLAELDKEPYQVACPRNRRRSTSRRPTSAAIAAARAIEAQAMSRRWDLQHAVQDVDNQVALLHARVAAVDKSKAALALAQVEFDRAKELPRQRQCVARGVRSAASGADDGRRGAHPGASRSLPGPRLARAAGAT